MEVVYQLRRWDWRIGRKNAPSCVILDALKLVQVVLRGAQQDGVSIIKTRLYEGKSSQVKGDYSAKQCEHFLQHSINSSGSRNQIQRTAQVGFQRRTKGNLF